MNEMNWQKFQDAEWTYSSRVSFEKVMEMREEKRKRRVIFWWFSSLGLLFLGTAGAYVWSTHSKATPPMAVLEPSASSARIAASSSSAQVAAESEPKRAKQNSVSTAEMELNPSLMNAAKASTKQKQAKPNLEIKEQTFVSAGKSEQTENRLQKDVQTLNPAQLFASSSETTHQEWLAPLFVNPYEALYSLGLTPSFAEWLDPFGLKEAYFDDRLLAETDFSNRFKPHYYAEITAFTGSHNSINFDNRDELSVLGTQYHAHYQGVILKDLGNGHMAGLGVSYGEWVGNGQYRNRTYETYTQSDTYHVVVVIPGNPVQTVEVLDTTTMSEWSETTGTLSYKMSKVSIPLAYRQYLPLGKTVWRLAMQASPGMTTRTSGEYFSRTEFLPLSTQRQFTFDARLAFGPSLPINRVWTLVLEPNLFAQSFVEGQSKQSRTKLFSGFGVSMVGKL